MLFFEDFLCGFPYEVYPTPARGKDGGYIVYARPAKGLKISIEGVDEFCAKHYQTRNGEIEWATLVRPGTRPLGNGSMTDSKFSARKLLNNIIDLSHVFSPSVSCFLPAIRHCFCSSNRSSISVCRWFRPDVCWCLPIVGVLLSVAFAA